MAGQGVRLALLLTVISATAVGFCAARGYALYDGDAEAHLNIARRVLDSRTPGTEQLGTVWLPLPHVLMLPFVVRWNWWRSGLAGSIPSAASFIAAGCFLFATARRLYGSGAAGWAAALLFALNPNMLYLQSIPMTEAVFAGALAALLWATVWFRDSQSIGAVLAAAAALNAASLTRYEGWFLVPFGVLYLYIAARSKVHALIFAVLAALGPIAWLAHNQYFYSNPLEFYDGDFSAHAIYGRQLAAGMARYPGDHNWIQAIKYYGAAIRLTGGWPLAALGVCGVAVALAKKIWWPLLLLALPPAFYLWSIHSSSTPLYVPSLWPNSWYNTRYALAALPLAALSAAAIVAALPVRAQTAGAAVIILGVSIPWVFGTAPVCWKESAQNSIARRAWTREAADYLAAHYQSGDGIIYSFGDLTGVLREAGIPLREGLHDGNRPAWDAAVLRPDLFLHEQWALAVSGDKVSGAILRAGLRGLHYELKRRIAVEGSREIQIYQRQWNQHP